MSMIQVQVRVPKNLVETLDEWIKEGRFKSRSDAIRAVLTQYEEREKTREFYRMLTERSKEAREHPEELVPLE
jgi:Arc/MetJ-type ribon-helix-helix transcriptional regulator